MKNALASAIAIAANVHENQTDRGGSPYILHPIRVMQRLRTNDQELMTIAILHDVVEDSEITINDLKEKGFSDRVINALELLTHSDGEEYEEYIRKIASNEDATRVKLEDLRDNSDITRLKGLRQKDHERMIKYNKAYMFLSQNVVD